LSGKNRLFKSGKTIRLQWDFCRSRISAGFGKSAGFRPEPEPKSGTALTITVGVAAKHPESRKHLTNKMETGEIISQQYFTATFRSIVVWKHVGMAFP